MASTIEELEDLISTLEHTTAKTKRILSKLKQTPVSCEQEPVNSLVQDKAQHWLDLFLADQKNLLAWYTCRQEAKINTSKALRDISVQVKSWSTSTGITISEAELTETLIENLL